VEETANSLLKKGWQNSPQNRMREKSTETRAPTIEILPVQSPNRLVGITRIFSGRDKLSEFIAHAKPSNVESEQSKPRGAIQGPCISRTNDWLASGRIARPQSWQNHHQMYGQKPVKKRVKNHPWNPKSPTKQANPSPRKVQKRVKNGPQKRHQKSRAEIHPGSTSN
jgi:hypothetical protein